MRARDIARALGARPVDQATPPGYARCTRCSGLRLAYADGRPALCARCSCADMGTTPYKLALAVEFHLSLARVDAKLGKDGTPLTNPKAWITARSRLRVMPNNTRANRGGGR